MLLLLLLLLLSLLSLLSLLLLLLCCCYVVVMLLLCCYVDTLYCYWYVVIFLCCYVDMFILLLLCCYIAMLLYCYVVMFILSLEQQFGNSILSIYIPWYPVIAAFVLLHSPCLWGCHVKSPGNTIPIGSLGSRGRCLARTTMPKLPKFPSSPPKSGQSEVHQVVPTVRHRHSAMKDVFHVIFRNDKDVFSMNS